jgi:hypothetical protein
MSVSNGTQARRIVELANLVQDSVAKLHQVLIDQNAPFPSFEEDAPTSLPDEALEFQRTVLGMRQLSLSICLYQAELLTDVYQ